MILSHVKWELVPKTSIVCSDLTSLLLASQVVLVVKNLPASVGDTRDVGLIPGSGRFPAVGSGNPLQLPGKFHGQRSLAGYGPCGHKESVMTE